jgi:HAD superfamily hydrolase (TIGR01459 family)
MSRSLPALIDHFSKFAGEYDVVLCDVWGVVHNGVAAFAEAGDALARFRAAGGHVALITNAPRAGQVVARQLDRMGVPRAAYDTIVSSGDVTRGVIAAHRGEKLFHLGPDRDQSIFTELGIPLVPLESADYVVCSGLFNDETETPEDYRALLNTMRSRRLFMICANPDVVVERGDRLVYCAGAIADLYASLGGNVLYAGKPHRPIYDRALEEITRLRGRSVPLRRVLAIGDSVRTDLTGATSLGVDCLFVTAGIHAEEFGSRENPEPAILADVFTAANAKPKAVTRRLVW